MKILITYRYFPMQEERVSALNIIPVIFAKDEAVCSRFEDYKKAQSNATENLANPNVISEKFAALDDAYIKLVEIIAKKLGYGKSITWDKLKNPYRVKKYIGVDGATYWY